MVPANDVTPSAPAGARPADQFEAALLSMDRIAVHSIARQIAQAADPLVNLEDLIVPTLERIGRLWEEGKVSLSQVYMAGRLCEGLIEPLTASRPDAAGAPRPLGRGHP